MKRKQANILDMLKKRKPDEPSDNDDNTTKICPYLLNSNDLTQETNYTVSVMAKVYFRDHSNINEVLDRYLERENITNVNKEIYLSAMIRHVISYSRIRRDYPFNMFKFASDCHETIGKFLLKYFEIKSNEDLGEANLYLSRTNLMHCQVSMDLNNKFRHDEEEYINQMREKVGYKNLKQFLCIASNHALRQYYLEHNLFVKYYIDDISLKEMCEISTIKRMTKRDMNQKGIPESAFDECLDSVFQALKCNRGLVISLEGFYIFPKYLLIINNLTSEQEHIVTERMDRFYSYTNAKDLLAIYKKNITLSNESDDPVTNRKERRKLFYLKYIRLVDKKQYPFNNLLWIKKGDIIRQIQCSNDAHLDCEAGPGSSNVWKKKTVTEKNDTAQDDRHREQENVVIEHRLARNPRDYLSAQISGSKYADIISILMNESEIIEEIKKDVIQNPLCAKMWNRNFKLILWNCIHINLEERNEHFMNLLMKCSFGNRDKLNEMLRQASIEVNLVHTIGEPIASSTQTMDIPFDVVLSPINDNQEKRPFQSINTDDIMDIKVPEFENQKKIKQEKCSEQSANSSDVEIVSLNVTDIVSISDEENTIISNNRVIPENNGIDVYQQNLNIDSQINHHSNDINASLEAEYGLISHRNAIQNVTNRRHDRNKPSRIVYDSDSTSSNNNAHN
ncbi:hypothetical protein ACKWTF_002252 [Chironomus riparius]